MSNLLDFEFIQNLLGLFFPDVFVGFVYLQNLSVCKCVSLHKHNQHTHMTKKQVIYLYSRRTANKEKKSYFLQVPESWWTFCFLCIIVSIWQNVPGHFWTNAHKHRRVKNRLLRKSGLKEKEYATWESLCCDNSLSEEQIKKSSHFLLFSLVESFHHKHYQRLNPKLLLTSHIVVYIGCKIQSFLPGVVHLCRAYRAIWDTATALCLFGDRDALSYFLLNLRIIRLNCPGTTDMY